MIIYICLICLACLISCCILGRHLYAEERRAALRPGLATREGSRGGRSGEIEMFGKNHTTSKPGVGLAAPQPAYAPVRQTDLNILHTNELMYILGRSAWLRYCVSDERFELNVRAESVNGRCMHLLPQYINMFSCPYLSRPNHIVP